VALTRAETSLRRRDRGWWRPRLATAYYLARNHGIRNVGLLERGWIGGGNTGRNTTIVRSNYLSRSARLYDFALKCYEGLSRELNFTSC